MDTQKVRDLIVSLRSDGREEDATLVEELLEELEEAPLLGGYPAPSVAITSFKYTGGNVPLSASGVVAVPNPELLQAIGSIKIGGHGGGAGGGTFSHANFPKNPTESTQLPQ